MDGNKEYAEGTNAMRGILVGTLITLLLFWGPLAALLNYQHILNWLGL